MSKALYTLAKEAFQSKKCSLKHVMSRIASDGQVGWHNGVSSDDIVRAF